jgi:hypothetical protein
MFVLIDDWVYKNTGHDASVAMELKNVVKTVSCPAVALIEGRP